MKWLLVVFTVWADTPFLTVPVETEELCEKARAQMDAEFLPAAETGLILRGYKAEIVTDKEGKTFPYRPKDAMIAATCLRVAD